MTLEPPSGFEHGTPGLGIQRFNHQDGICKVLPSNRKNIFYRSLHHPIQRRSSLLISESVWHNFAEKYAKIIVFLATMIRLLTSLCTVIYGSSTVFCNYYQFCTDATMVSKKFKEKQIIFNKFLFNRRSR